MRYILPPYHQNLECAEWKYPELDTFLKRKFVLDGLKTYSVGITNFDLFIHSWDLFFRPSLADLNDVPKYSVSCSKSIKYIFLNWSLIRQRLTCSFILGDHNEFLRDFFCLHEKWNEFLKTYFRGNHQKSAQIYLLFFLVNDYTYTKIINKIWQNFILNTRKMCETN